MERGSQRWLIALAAIALVAFAAGLVEVWRRPAAVVRRIELAGPLRDAGPALEALEEARQTKRVKAVLLAVNSPGGDVAAAQDVFAAVTRLREAGKPVVAAIGSIGASGGYYVSIAADELWAEPGSLTGSIGVIYERLDVSRLAGRFGVAREAVTAGAYKDAGSMWRSPTAQETAMIHELIDDLYAQFLETVRARRRLDEAALRRAADGRLWTGRPAQALGLIDRLGSWQDAGRRAAELAGLPAETPIEDGETGPFAERLLRRWLRTAAGSAAAPGLWEVRWQAAGG